MSAPNVQTMHRKAYDMDGLAVELGAEAATSPDRLTILVFGDACIPECCAPCCCIGATGCTHKGNISAIDEVLLHRVPYQLQGKITPEQWTAWAKKFNRTVLEGKYSRCSAMACIFCTLGISVFGCVQCCMSSNKRSMRQKLKPVMEELNQMLPGHMHARILSTQFVKGTGKGAHSVTGSWIAIALTQQESEKLKEEPEYKQKTCGCCCKCCVDGDWTGL